MFEQAYDEQVFESLAHKTEPGTRLIHGTTRYER